MTPLGLAWSNLAHKRTRTAVAAFGVAFAVALIFMEMGMFGGVSRTATMLYDALRFDLLFISSEYTDVSHPGTLPHARLHQATGADGVEGVAPISFGMGTWRLPKRQGWFGSVVMPDGIRSVNILGVPPGQVAQVFAIDRGRVFRSTEEAEAAGEKIARLDAFLYDVRSKPEFGRPSDLIGVPPEGEPIDPAHPEVRNVLRLNGRRLEVVGTFDLGTGFSWNALLMGSEESLTHYTMQPLDRVTFGLVTLRPGADAAAVQRQLRAMLPPDVRVLTRSEVVAQEQRYWMRLTSVGQFLGVAVGLAVVVGVIFVYQMMAADIRNMLPEYATVKALGYRPPYLTGVVLWQAVLLAVLGFLPGFAASFGLYYVARNFGGIPTEMTGERAVIILGMTCGMCLASGLLAVRKVHTADPADLF